MDGNVHLDTNLALLLVVGETDIKFITEHKRLQKYDAVDFNILKSIFKRRSRIIFSPNILTETSNLSRYIKEPFRSRIALTLMRMISLTSEFYAPSRDIVVRPEFLSLGVADAALLELTKRHGGTLLTDDLDLYLAALKASLTAVNFNHIRDRRPDFT